MEVAKYLLKNSDVLKKLTIYPGMHIPREQWYEQEKLVYKELCAFKWGSKTCRVEFI